MPLRSSLWCGSATSISRIKTVRKKSFKQNFLLTLVVMFFFVISAHSQVLFAQTTTNDQEKINVLTVKYRDSVEAYRSREREFQIAKQEYQQLETLASLENAVKATKAVYLSRTEVLAVYIELLQNILMQAQGIPVLEKQRTLEDIILRLEAIQRHKASILEAQDKVAIEVLADQFELMRIDIDATVHRAQSFIVLGKFNVVYAQAQELKKVIENDVESRELNELQKAEYQRAFDEVDRSLTKVESSLASIHSDIAASDAEYSLGFYNLILSRLSEPYSGLRKVVSFFEELTAQ